MKSKAVARPRPTTKLMVTSGEPESINTGPFSIIGIGASAGGLEALEQLLGNTPANCGLAFVIIQHLDPTHKGIMPQLLQRATGMAVIQVIDRTRVQANHVYVIPPNNDMSILYGILHLLEPSAPRGLRRPIDFFFRSLAEDQKERSIGVILSGMGSDGTLGLRAIKGKAGLVVVQDPATAKYDSMPRSAIEAGLADLIAPAAGISGKILDWIKRRPLTTRKQQTLPGKAQSALEKVVLLLRAQTGHDFTHYKHNTLYRRIERRMGIHQIDKIADYIRYLQESPQELDLLFKELLIGVTNFFRDQAAWEQLGKVVIPALLKDRPSGHVVRAWIPACSSGEEAYTMAMVLRETIEAFTPKGSLSIQIFATDLDRDAIDKARYGLFTDSIAADLSPERLNRFFNKEDGGYRVRREIREVVIFAAQNLIMDPPFTHLDILSCRNLLIYLSPEVQKKLIPLFHYSLNPGGVLFLGSAETVGDFTNLFSSSPGNSSIFQSKETTLESGPLEFPTSFSEPISSTLDTRKDLQPEQDLQTLADQLVLQGYAPPSALVNDKGDILYTSGRTGKYLEPAAGKANWNLFAMARDWLRNELYSVFQKALRHDGKVTVLCLKAEDGSADSRIEISVERLDTPERLNGLMLIVFTEIPVLDGLAEAVKSTRSPGDLPDLEELQRELKKAREEARITREGMQTSHQELRSTNEELQSTNEELQSTNEELMTSKEEMQSLNEELQTVNTELQAKVDEWLRANSDIKNLLNSTEIATVFLDNDLNVRRYTEQATKIIKLIPSDVGRPMTDLASQLCYPELANDVRGVLEKLVALETPVKTLTGGWFTVRIMPYRTVDNCIDGVVITFADITAAHGALNRKTAENSYAE